MSFVVCPKCGTRNSEFNPRCQSCNDLLPPSSAGISHPWSGSSGAGQAPALPPESSLVGRLIDHFRVTDLLGRGGMGEVYRAIDEKLEREVALKVVRSDISKSDEVRRRFQREAKAAGTLEHPSIVRIYDVLEHQEGDFIVMELVEGSTLSDFLEGKFNNGQFKDLRLLVSLARDVAEGLAVAHGCGVVHRDLKPENIMVTREGRAKILDFGLAKLFSSIDGDGQSEASLTIDGGVVGTFRAMSPEQAQGFKVDHRSDLFSLGTMLYEVTTGQSPFRRRGIAATLAQLCVHRQAPALELNANVPEALSMLIDWLLEKNRADRPQSADEVVAALEDILSELE